MRDLTAGMAAAVTAPVIAPIMLAEALFDSGPVRLWSGYGELSWAGLTWYGTGHLLSVSTIAETQELRATGATFALSGIPSDMVGLALREPYQGRPVRLLFGALDVDTGVIIGDPYEVFGGRCDVMEITEGGDTATIEVAVESRLIDLERARERRYEHEDQQTEFPGDRGLEYVPAIQNQNIKWGR